MALAVGIDLVDVEDVRRALREHGDRYLTAVYTDAERAQCAASAPRLAERFAAKEATIKALACAERPPWCSIEVTRDQTGEFAVTLTGPAAVVARERGVVRLAASLSRSGPEAVAVVLAT